MKSRWINLALGFGISGLLIVWMIGHIEWRQVQDQILTANYIYLIPIAAVLVVHFLLRAVRWRYLLPPESPIPLRASFDALMIGNLATFLLPLRAGEFIRPGVLTLKENIGFSTAFVSIVIERFFDLSAVLFSFGLLTLVLPGIPTEAMRGAQVLMVLAAAILAFIFCSALLPRQLIRLSDFFISFLPQRFRPKLKGFLDNFMTGAGVLADWPVLIRVVILTALVWVSTYLFFYLFFLVFDIPAGFIAAVAVGVIVALAVAAPSAPGFIGVYQAGCLAAFALFGVREDVGTAYAIVNHVFQYIVVVALGMIALGRTGLRLGKIREMVRAGS